MRSLVLCGLVVALVGAAHAAAQDRPPRVDSAGPRDFGHSGRHHHHYGGRGHRHSLFWFDFGFPLYWSGGYAPLVDSYFPPYHTFGYFFTFPAPTIVPGAGDPPPAPAPANNQLAVIAPAPAPAAKAQPRVTNAEHKARAGRFLGFGNASFAQQKYLAAIERYKTAVQIAPDVAESYFRQAAAHVALAQYDSAARAFRRGLQVKSDWNAAPFLLDQLYDDAPLAKTRHLEDLARAVEANPLDADLLLVLGMELFLDGQLERARVFLSRSAQLGGNEDQLLDALLGKPKPAGAAGAEQPRGKISF
jgi:hypothetical protein